MLVKVAVARKLADYQDVLTYSVPEVLQRQVRPGSLVLVPMGRGNQQVNGYVLGWDDNADAAVTYKDILSVPEPETLLTAELVELALWLSQYYLCPCYYVLEYMLPKFARSKKKELVVWNGDSDLAQTQLLFLDGAAAQMAATIRQKGQTTLAALQKQWPHANTLLEQLEAVQLVRQEVAFVQQGSSKEEFIYESCIAVDDLDMAQKQLQRATRQWEVLRFLTYEGPSDGKVLRSYWPSYLSLIKELEKKAGAP